MVIEIGLPAPGFTLYDSDKNSVSLADFRGKNVVLLFFPLAFTSTCTKELCSVRDAIADYDNAQAQVLGISVDSLYVLNQYKRDQQLNFPLLSDFNREASKSYNVLYDIFPAFQMRGVSKRAAFVIDQKGLLQYADVCQTPGELPNFEGVMQVLSRLASLEIS